jgi:hypothetical protein
VIVALWIKSRAAVAEQDDASPYDDEGSEDELIEDEE